MTASTLESRALAVLEIEAAAISQLQRSINQNFTTACQLLLACQGRVIVTGIGKSGHIANKLAATLASTGTPAFYVHPSEASHGDMGMLQSGDAVIALSNSGNTAEINLLLPFLQRKQIPIIAITGNLQSNLAHAATVVLDVTVEQEACPLGLAPTASTIAQLAMGDALAIALLEARGFSVEDFALSHPGGTLGKRLLLRVSDLMRTGDALPLCQETTLLADALLVMTEKKLGMTLVVNAAQQLSGIFTDGDLRRSIAQAMDIHQTRLQTLMSRAPKVIAADALAVTAVNLMENERITSLAIQDTAGRPIGVVHMHDLLQAGVV